MLWGVPAALAAALSLLLAAAAPCAAHEPPPPPQFYGVVSQGELGAQDFQRMGAGRVGTVRVTMHWAEIDPTPLPNDYDWSDFDAIVAGAAGQSIEVLPTIYSTPHWVSTLEQCEGPQRGPCGITPPSTQVGLSAWRSFIAAAVSRYGTGGTFWAQHPELPARPIVAWQVWNEQNSPGFYQPRPNVGDYARLLDVAAAAIRAEDPRAEVLLGGMFRYPLGGADGGIRATDFLQRLYERGGSGDFDGIAIHPYAARLSGVEHLVGRMSAIASAAGDADAGLWITEVGWASGGGPNPLNRGLRGQATRLSRAFAWFTANREALDLRLVAWYAWRDLPLGETRCDWCARSGLFRLDGLLAKPAWNRFLRFTGGS
jgi:hypothetical protein